MSSPTLRRWRLVAALAAGVPSLPATALAQEDAAQRWQLQALEINERLASGEWTTARDLTRRLEDELSDSVVAGGRRPLGQLAVFRALAGAGLGRRQEALWFWRLAPQLFPEVDQLDLTPYGEAGRLLLDNLPLTREEELARLDLADASEVEPPRRVHTEVPRFPQGRYVPGRSVSVIVSTILGTDGVPRSPEIVEASGEWTMVYAALNALQGWRFEPARRDGQPVAVVHELSVRFEVPQ